VLKRKNLRVYDVNIENSILIACGSNKIVKIGDIFVLISFQKAANDLVSMNFGFLQLSIL
jgi:hypothetical protein